MSDARRLVDKLWSYCNGLRDDGVSTSTTPSSLPPAEVLAREIVDDLEAALAEFTAVADALEKAAAERGG